MLLDQIHGLHMALVSLNKAIKKIKPDRCKSVISRMPNLFFHADQQNYILDFSYILQMFYETH